MQIKELRSVDHDAKEAVACGCDDGTVLVFVKSDTKNAQITPGGVCSAADWQLECELKALPMQGAHSADGGIGALRWIGEWVYAATDGGQVLAWWLGSAAHGSTEQTHK